jgi:post-segregation antitoxin (ccd killing protein)
MKNTSTRISNGQFLQNTCLTIPAGLKQRAKKAGVNMTKCFISGLERELMRLENEKTRKDR